MTRFSINNKIFNLDIVRFININELTPSKGIYTTYLHTKNVSMFDDLELFILKIKQDEKDRFVDMINDSLSFYMIKMDIFIDVNNLTTATIYKPKNQKSKYAIKFTWDKDVGLNITYNTHEEVIQAMTRLENYIVAKQKRFT